MTRRKKRKNLKDLSFSCQKELARKLRLYARSEQYLNLSQLVEDYLLSLLGIVKKKPGFDLEANAVCLGSNLTLAGRIHVRVGCPLYNALLKEAKNRSMTLSALTRLLLRDALKLRWENIHPLGRSFSRKKMLIGLVLGEAAA